MLQIFKTLSQGSNAKGARSTALHSLQWGLGLILAGLTTATWVKSPDWIIILLAILLCTLFLTYIGSYIYLLFSDRDALRSESFTLSKMAIERGLLGDNVTGLIDESTGATKALDISVVNDEEDTE